MKPSTRSRPTTSPAGQLPGSSVTAPRLLLRRAAHAAPLPAVALVGHNGSTALKGQGRAAIGAGVLSAMWSKATGVVIRAGERVQGPHPIQSLGGRHDPVLSRKHRPMRFFRLRFTFHRSMPP